MPSVAYTGILYFFDKVPKLFTWSICSCVTIIASNFSAETSIEESAFSIFLALSPASTNIFVLSLCTNKLFPLLPLYKLQKLNILLLSYSNYICT